MKIYRIRGVWLRPAFRSIGLMVVHNRTATLDEQKMLQQFVVLARMEDRTFCKEAFDKI